MDGMRVITILIEVYSRKLGGGMLLLPFEDAWLSANTCRELLLRVLVTHLERPTALATAEHI